jgi:folate-binding protein YgfZ
VDDETAVTRPGQADPFRQERQRAPDEPADTRITLLLAGDLAETIRRRLAMFVLRANVTIEDVTAASTLIGIAGDGNAEATREAFGVAPARGHAVAFGEDASGFMLPDRRIVVVAPHAEGVMLHAALARHATSVGNDEWRWFGIAAGVPWITAATSDLFVPQTANWDLLGGVSFGKGCYPGQEIVARMQYLGRLKERLFAFHADTLEAAPAMRLYAATFDPEQPCGTVVNAAPDAAGGVALLAVAQIAAVDANDLALGARGGPPLVRRALPYAIPNDAPRTRPAH